MIAEIIPLIFLKEDKQKFVENWELSQPIWTHQRKEQDQCVKTFINATNLRLCQNGVRGTSIKNFVQPR